MNESTNQLIRYLAAKLGTTTTTEHLWGVLIKQAPIDATCTLIGLLLSLPGFSSLAFWCWRKARKDSDYWPGVVAFLVLVLINCIAAAFATSTILAGYFNPEYWALDHVLSMLKPAAK